MACEIARGRPVGPALIRLNSSIKRLVPVLRATPRHHRVQSLTFGPLLASIPIDPSSNPFFLGLPPRFDSRRSSPTTPPRNRLAPASLSDSTPIPPRPSSCPRKFQKIKYKFFTHPLTIRSLSPRHASRRHGSKYEERETPRIKNQRYSFYPGIIGESYLSCYFSNRHEIYIYIYAGEKCFQNDDRKLSFSFSKIWIFLLSFEDTSERERESFRKNFHRSRDEGKSVSRITNRTSLKFEKTHRRRTMGRRVTKGRLPPPHSPKSCDRTEESWLVSKAISNSASNPSEFASIGDRTIRRTRFLR